MPRRAKESVPLDRELEDLPPQLRCREWMGRVEAVFFASAEPAAEMPARVVGKSCNPDLLIDDIREELRGRPLRAGRGGRRLAAPDAQTTCRGDPGGDGGQRERQGADESRGGGVDGGGVFSAGDAGRSGRDLRAGSGPRSLRSARKA